MNDNVAVERGSAYKGVSVLQKSFPFQMNACFLSLLTEDFRDNKALHHAHFHRRVFSMNGKWIYIANDHSNHHTLRVTCTHTLST